MLLERIKDIFGQDFSNSLARFRVQDGGTDRGGLSVVLLVESPHTHEVRHGYPLAGSQGHHAGRLVRDKFMQFRPGLQLPEQPIGKLVNEEHDTVRTLGIMNVSQLPLKEESYGQNNDVCQNQRWNEYKNYINTIRSGPGACTRQCTDCQNLDNAIAEDLRRRLRCLHENNPDVLLVRCGEVASAFYTKAVEHYLPHPSRKGWQGLNPEGRRSREEQYLQRIVCRLWPPQAAA